MIPSFILPLTEIKLDRQIIQDVFRFTIAELCAEEEHGRQDSGASAHLADPMSGWNFVRGFGHDGSNHPPREVPPEPGQ